MSCLCGLFGAKIRIILIGCKFFRKIFYCSHRWLQQRHSRLDANKAVGDDADDAADEGGVDDVPLSPEDSTEYY